MTGIKQKYQDLFFQTEQTVNRKKSGFRAARNSMQNLLSYCGLVDAKIRASDIDLPVLCSQQNNVSKQTCVIG